MATEREQIDLRGRVCIVTGASSGIGRATAIQLANLGATVVLVCRDVLRGKAVLDDIARDRQDHHAELLIADLSSGASIRKLAAEFIQKHSQLHVLINNAGVAVRSRTLSVDKIELTFAVNHLAGFLLTNLLLDRLKAGAPSRVINVTSEAHRDVPLDFENLQGQKRFQGFQAYGLSKLCNIIFTYELSRRLEGTRIMANAIHPGYLNTRIFRKASMFVRFLAFLSAGSPKKGARAIVHLATAPELEGMTGKYFKGTLECDSSPVSHDREAAKHLWDISAGLTGLVKPSKDPRSADRRIVINAKNASLQAWIRSYWRQYYADNPQKERRKARTRR